MLRIKQNILLVGLLPDIVLLQNQSSGICKDDSLSWQGEGSGGINMEPQYSRDRFISRLEVCLYKCERTAYTEKHLVNV